MAATIVTVRDDCTKVSVIGHSMGSMQLFFGMGRGKYMQPYFSQAVALAPCLIPSYKQYFPEFDVALYTMLSGLMESLDIESLFGPDWANQRQKLCDVLGRDTPACQHLHEVPLGVLAGGEIDGLSEVSCQ